MERSSALLSEWKRQLITPEEDHNHVHKTLGLMCLVSFFWRLSQTGDADSGFARYPRLSIPTMLLHLALNLSSFRFDKIPKRRISSGYRIWPEYRLHSLIFACRSLVFMSLFWAEAVFGFEASPVCNLVIVLVTMAAAEWASVRQGQYRSGFARNLDVDSWSKFFFSNAQFAATAICLVGQRRYTMQFLMVFIIQGT